MTVSDSESIGYRAALFMNEHRQCCFFYYGHPRFTHQKDAMTYISKILKTKEGEKLMKNKGLRAVSILLTFMISVQSFCTGAVLPEIAGVAQEQTVEETSEEVVEASTESITEEIAEETSETATETDALEDTQEETVETTEVCPEEIDASELPYRILVAAQDEDILTDGVIISGYDGVYLIGYDSEEKRAEGYEYYSSAAAFAEYDDDIFEIADEEMTEDAEETAEVINKDDALTALTELDESDAADISKLIAVIDTGDNGKAADAVSVIGESVSDDNGHGSMVIDTILEENPNAKILSIKAFGSDGKAKPSDIYAAVRYAMDNNAEIINMSFSAFSTAENTIVKDIISEAAAEGITIVGAAGNKGKELKYFIPGSIEEAEIVGAVDKDKNFLSTNNYGATLDWLTYGESSSEAAARFTGIYSKEGVNFLGSGKVFRHEYKEVTEETNENEEIPEEFGDIQWLDQDPDFKVASVTIGGSVYPSRITLKNVRITGADYSVIYNRQPWNDPTTGSTYIRGTALYWTFSGDSSCSRGWYASGGGDDDLIDEDKYSISQMQGFCTYAGRVEPTGFTKDVQLRIVTADQTDYDPSDTGHARYIASGIKMIDSETYQTVGVQVKLVPIKTQESDFYIGIQKSSSTGFNPSMDDTVYHITDATANHNIFYELTLSSTGKIKSAKAYKSGSIDRSTVTINGTDKLQFMGVEYFNNIPYIHIHRTNLGGLASNMLMLHESSANKYYKLNTSYDPIPAIGDKNRVLLTAHDCPSLAETPKPETPKGAIQVFKTDENNNPLEGVVFTVYSDQACKNKVTEITTKSTGLGGAIVSAGTYYVKETKGKNGYKPDTSKEPYKCIVDTTYTFAAGGQNYGPVFDSRDYISKAYNPGQDLVKAFGNDKDKLAGHFSNYGMREGRRASVNYDLAEYKKNYVKNGYMDGKPELKDWENEDFYNHFANYGITEGRLARPVSEFKNMPTGVNQNSTAVVVIRAINTKSSIYVTVTKSATSTSCTKNNPNYSLKGTEIGLYETKADAINNKNVIHTFVMDETGKTTAYQIPDSKLTYDVLGNVDTKTFWLKETKAGKGYQLNDEPKDVKITAANTESNPAKANIENEPTLDPVDIYIVKNDVDGAATPEGTGSLEGAEFTIKYYAVDTTKAYTATELAKLTPAAHWTIKTKYDSLLKKYRAHLHKDWLAGTGNSAFYYENDNEEPLLPLGFITIQETKASMGYTTSGATYKWSDGSTTKDSNLVARTNDSKSLFVGNKTVTGDIIVNETPIRGNFTLKKVDEKNKPMADVQFKITNTATKESHTVKTDKNGAYSSSTAGLWFSKRADGSETKKITGLGSLPTGTYKVEEQRCEANKGKQLEPAITFTVSSATTYNLSATGKDEVITNVDMPAIGTTASVVSTSSKLVPQNSDVSITDVVTYSHLKAATDYTLAGKLMVVEKDGTYKPYQKDGKDYVVTKTFKTPESYTKSVYNVSGSTSVTFNINSTGLEDKSITVFEKLYLGKTVPAKDSDATQYSDNPGIFPVVHEDKADLAQTVYVPYLTTAAESDGDQMILPEENAVIIDTISYDNLLKGETFTVKGRIVDKATGKTVLDAKGKEVTAEREFKANGASGTVEMTYKFDASNMSGKTLVCFESIYYKNILVMEHADINDKAQTVYLPTGKTRALDNKTGQHITLAEKKAEITDYLTYSGLIAGKEYTSVGTMYDADTEEPVKDSDGNVITSTVKFKAENESGEIEIPFQFDASILAGKKIVIFEDVFCNGRQVLIHHDINDTEQTIWIPKGFTTAKDSKTNDHLMLAEEEASIVDTISYFGLPTGQSYTASGMLIDKTTGLPLTDKDGKMITASADFIPETEDGTIDVTYNFDASLLAGHTIVIYEDVYSNGKAVIVHHSLEDENQTIYIPSGHTEARDGKTETATGLAETEAEIIDRVYFENLIIDKTYECTGTLYEKETGEPFKDVEGKIITNTVSFEPTSTSGFIEVPFKYDASLLKGKTVVSFEDVTYEGNTVFIHHDITDEKQSVNYPAVRTTATLKNAGKKVLAGSDVTVIDEVSYSNVRIGDRFKVKGYMVNKSTGEKFLVNGKPIEAEKEFTAEAKDGVIDMQFGFNTAGIDKLDLVVYEELVLLKDVEGETIELMVASHADINDLNQTVSIITVPKTGDEIPVLPIAGAGTAAFSGIVMILIRKKRNTVKR